MRSTYSPEDNKLRVYPEGERVDSRLTESEYASFKDAGFRWAAKQECFVAAGWSPSAEEWAMDLADSGEIDDEDYSMAERSADRAERFSGYREKRADEAMQMASRVDGIGGLGYQDAKKASIAERRASRVASKAVTQWDKAEYWQSRTEGVIRHALYRARPEVRRSRIDRLEAEQRKHEKAFSEAVSRWNSWLSILNHEGPDADAILMTETEEQLRASTAVQRRAYVLVSTFAGNRDLEHPQTGVRMSAYKLLVGCENRVSPREIARLWLDAGKDPATEDSRWNKWSRHYAMRLSYERAMLANEGGAATDMEMVLGGWIVRSGVKCQIERVWKSPATKRVSSVQAIDRASGKTFKIDLERLGEDVYLAPTDDELREFNASIKAAKAAKVPVSIINPTVNDAERLQEILNRAALIERSKQIYPGEVKTQEVCHTESGEFSRALKYEYVHIREFFDGQKKFKVRTKRPGMYGWSNADRVCILDDKPAKPLGINWAGLEEVLCGAGEASVA